MLLIVGVFQPLTLRLTVECCCITITKTYSANLHFHIVAISPSIFHSLKVNHFVFATYFCNNFKIMKLLLNTFSSLFVSRKRTSCLLFYIPCHGNDSKLFSIFIGNRNTKTTKHIKWKKTKNHLKFVR